MSISVRGLDLARARLNMIGKQAPYALSVALNGAANAVQAAVRGGLNERFTLRRKTFIEQTIYRNKATDFATKTRPQAMVRVNPERDVLGKFERGETKTPIDGRSIAIPSENVRRTKRDLITDANKPRALLAKKGYVRIRDVLYKRVGRGKRQKLQALYLFRRSARIRPMLGMQDTADRVVPQVWQAEAMRAIDRALATAR